MKAILLFSFLSILFFSKVSPAANSECEQIKIESITPQTESVSITDTSGASRNGKVGDPLAQGDQIQTKENMLVDLRICDGSAIRLDSNTSYKFTSTSQENSSQAWLFELNNGSMRALVTPAKQKDFIKFRLTSPSGSVGVRGTEFYASYKPETDQTSLFTIDGKVLFGKREDLAKMTHFTNANLGESFIQVEKNTASGISRKMDKPSVPKQFDAKIFEDKPIFRNGLTKTKQPSTQKKDLAAPTKKHAAAAANAKSAAKKVEK